MSLAIATTILRTVSDWAASPKLTLSSLVTPSTSMATSGPNSVFRSVEGVGRVLDGVVQQRGGQSGAAQAQFGEDGGYGHRVRDVRIPALALLPAVAALGHDEGALDEVEVLFADCSPARCAAAAPGSANDAVPPLPANRASRDMVRSRRPGKAGGTGCQQPEHPWPQAPPAEPGSGFAPLSAGLPVAPARSSSNAARLSDLSCVLPLAADYPGRRPAAPTQRCAGRRPVYAR